MHFAAHSLGELMAWCNQAAEKEESVREWILASDVVISSFSSTLIEAALGGKPAFMVEPVPLIKSFYNAWYDHVARIKNLNEFEKACLDKSNEASSELQDWAT